MGGYMEAQKAIRESIASGQNRFIICPFGELGLLVQTILINQYGLHEVALADNILSGYNENILRVKELEKYKEDDVIVLLTSNNETVRNEVYECFSAGRVKCLVSDDEPKIKIGKVKCLVSDDKPKIKIGKFSYGPITQQVEEIDSIGAFYSFGPGSRVCFNHLMGMVTTHEFLFASSNCKELSDIQKYTWEGINRKTVIGNDVWFGENVIVLNGAQIGNGVIAGAGSIITKDVPDYAVVVGNPARIIRYRFTQEQIVTLNKIAWWDWPVEKIKSCYDDFFDINTFLMKHYKGD